MYMCKKCQEKECAKAGLVNGEQSYKCGYQFVPTKHKLATTLFYTCTYLYRLFLSIVSHLVI